MKIRASLAFLFLIFSSLWILTACAAEPEFKGMLWKVTDPSTKRNGKELHILGSIHKVSTQNLKFSQEIRRSFERSSTIVLEGNPDLLSVDIQALTNMNLKNYIDLETESKLVAYLVEIGLRKAQIDYVLRLHPYALLRYLNDEGKRTKRALEKYDFRNIPKYPGVDAILLWSARNGGKSIKFLETDDDVARIWIETCPSKTENSVAISHSIDLLTGAKQISKNFLEAFLAFEKGDTQHFKDWYLSEETQQSADNTTNQKCSVVPRNFFWKSKIIDHLKSAESTLMIVGAAHLLGKGSLIELLQNEGFVLEELSK